MVSLSGGLGFSFLCLLNLLQIYFDINIEAITANKILCMTRQLSVCAPLKFVPKFLQK